MRLSSVLRAWKARAVGALRRGRGGPENGRERPLSAREVAAQRVQAHRAREEAAERRLQELRENPPYLVSADGTRYTPGMAAPHRKTNRKDT